jgi:hypothetical protein
MPKLAALRRFLHRIRIPLSIGVALLVAPAASAEAQVLTFLSPVPEKDGTINYAVGPEVDLRLPFTATENGALEIRVLPFTGERGDVLLVEPSIAEQPNLGVKERVVSFSMDQPILTLRLKGPGLPAPTKYTGVIFARQGKTQQTNRVVLTLAPALRPAKVAVDPKSVTIYQTGRSRRATFKVQALNTSADWQADGVFLRLLEVTAPPGTNFDPASNLKLTWNGTETTDLWRSPNADSPRSILPNRQADIGGELVRVAREYTVKVGLGAANAVVEGDQSITMKLYVKHGLGWPIAVLLLAIGVSWFSTKGLEAQRRRVTQLKKIGDIRQDGMQEEPAPLPAVAARAILKQAQDRNRSWFGALFGQDTTGARLDKAELLLGILARVRTIQSRIKSAAWGLLPRNRANKELARITGSLNPATVDENAAKKLEADLDALERWFDTGQFDEQYWLNLKKEMAGLLSYVEPANFAHHVPLVTQLRDEIQAAVDGQPPAGPQPGAQQPGGQQSAWQPKGRDISKVEEKYAKLKILWERSHADDNDTLLKLGDDLKNPKMSIEAFFRLADDEAWSKLKDAKFEFITPVPNQVDPPTGYQLIHFKIAPENRKLGENYLFKHKIEYTWKLEFKRKPTWCVAVWNFIFRKSEKWLPLTQARTNEPHVIQYVPDQGTLSMSVRLNYDASSDKRNQA